MASTKSKQSEAKQMLKQIFTMQRAYKQEKIRKDAEEFHKGALDKDRYVEEYVEKLRVAYQEKVDEGKQIQI